MASTAGWYLDPAVVGGAEKLAGERADHPIPVFAVTCVQAATCLHQICLSTHRDASRPLPRAEVSSAKCVEIEQSEVQRQKPQQNRAIAVERSGRDRLGQCLVNGAKLSSEFIILPGFSRCQGGMIGRVSRRRHATPIFKTRIFMTSSFPKRTAFALGLAALAARPVSAVFFGRRPAGACPGRKRCWQGQRRGNPPERPRAGGRGTRPAPPADGPGDQADNSWPILIDLKIVAKAAEDKKIEQRRGLQEAARLHPQPAADGRLLAAEGKAATTDEAMRKVYEEAAKQIAGERRSAPATSWSRARTRPRRSRGAEEGRRFRRAGQEEIEGSRRRRWRRSRLLHQGPDGAGILRGRLQARPRQDLRPGEVAVRLARHQGRGKAQRRRRSSTRSRPRSRPM